MMKLPDATTVKKVRASSVSNEISQFEMMDIKGVLSAIVKFTAGPPAADGRRTKGEVDHIIIWLTAAGGRAATGVQIAQEVTNTTAPLEPWQICV